MQPKQNNSNFLLFATLSLGVMLLCMWLSEVLWPRPKPDPVEPQAVYVPPKPDAPRALTALVGQIPGGDIGTATTQIAVAARWADYGRLARKPKAEAPEAPKAPKHPRVTPVLGGEGYFLTATLDARGGGVRSVLLNDFQKANHLGQPVWEMSPDGVRKKAPMELVQASVNAEDPSNVFYHYANPDEIDPRPLPDLGRTNWEQVGPVEEIEEGQRVSFRTTAGGVTVTKVFTLKKGDYHIGLEVKLEAERETAFRYQLTGAHGLPIEGDWFTYTFRNAIITRAAGSSVTRSFQDMREIARHGGGSKVPKEGSEVIQFGGVAIQYFASMVVVDDDQKDRNFLAWARPTVLSTVLKGTIESVADDGKSFVLKRSETLKLTMHTDGGGVLVKGVEPRAGEKVTLVFRPDDHDRNQVLEIYKTGSEPRVMFDDMADINVRLVSDKLDLKPGEAVVHKYLLYNGPAKVRLLGMLDGERKVDPALVNRYETTLHLNTITDYHWANFWGDWVTGPTGLSWVLIQITNLMHSVLFWLHQLVPIHGLNVIMLTVLVRLMMVPFSLKQARMQVKMSELAPELKKLQAKYGEDRQAMSLAQWELYKKHGVNPMGSCWLLLVQMPIFLGLYYCLQESIMFRLAPFLWIQNLAAPDMLWEWGQNIPVISDPASYGGMLYLGPFLNILPIFSTALMVVQQKLMTPPATNEEEEVRNRTMLFMSIFMGLMFYKMPAGLCVYFIATTLWGLTERQLLPKKKKVDDTADTVASPAAAVGTTVTPAVPAPEVRTEGGRKKNKKKNRGRKEENGTEAPAKDGQAGVVGRLRQWWREVLKAAEKKAR
jgi:YidC/Oxa1 family membrane protein insertase